MIFGYFALAATFYFYYGVSNSVGNNSGWATLLSETGVRDQEDFDYTNEFSSHDEGAARSSLSGRLSNTDYSSHLKVTLLSSETLQRRSLNSNID
jgi:hypothetical protein